MTLKSKEEDRTDVWKSIQPQTICIYLDNGYQVLVVPHCLPKPNSSWRRENRKERLLFLQPAVVDQFR